MRYRLGAWGSLAAAAIASRPPIIAPLQKSFKGRRRKWPTVDALSGQVRVSVTVFQPKTAQRPAVRKN